MPTIMAIQWADTLLVGGGVSACLLAPALARHGPVTILEDGAGDPAADGGTLLSGLRSRMRQEPYDYQHAATLVAGDEHYSQGRSLGGGSNLNGGLWIPPSSQDRERYGFFGPIVPAPFPLEVSAELDPVSAALVAQMMKAGATLPDRYSPGSGFRLATTHARGRRRSFGDLLPAGGAVTARTNYAITRIARRGRRFIAYGLSPDIAVETGRLIVSAGVLSSPRLIAGSFPKLIDGKNPPWQVADHLALRLTFRTAAAGNDGGHDRFLTSGPMTKVAGIFDLPTGRDGFGQRMIVFGSPVAVRWPRWGAPVVLGPDYYAITLMLCYPRSRGSVAWDGNSRARVAMRLDQADVNDLVGGADLLRSLLAGLLAEGAVLRGGDHPLSVARFLRRPPDAGLVLRRGGLSHHPIGTVSPTLLARIRDAGFDVFDAAIVPRLPVGTIMPVLAELATRYRPLG